METQVIGYNGIFPTILRELLDRHPQTKAKTTLKELGESCGIRQQTVSLYKNGETQPTPETLVKISAYFGVSIDYLLTGVSSQNKSINEELGLSEEAIYMLKRVKKFTNFDNEPMLINVVNELLSDSEFYDFLDDASFKVSQIKALDSNKIDQSILGTFNVEGYFIWELQMFVQDFIRKQLVKRGLEIYVK